MREISENMIIALFLVLISPGLIVPVANKLLKVEWGVNKIKSSAPKLNFENFEDFPKDFDGYYGQNLPFRDNIKNIWTSFNYFVMNDSPNTGVVLGKYDETVENRWLFYSNNEDQNPIYDAQGVTTFSEPVMDKMLDRINKTETKLAEKGIDYFVFIIPNKESMYREKLPDDVKIYSTESRTDKFIEYAKEKEVNNNIIYVKDALLSAKNDFGQVYWKQDTHWNSFGAIVGYETFMKKVYPNFAVDYSVNFDQKQVNRDLVGMLDLYDYFVDVVPEVSFLENELYELDRTYKFSNVDITTNLYAPIKETVMLVGDSYRDALLNYFGKTFSKVVFVHRRDYDSSMIDKYSPSVVLSEYVERYVPAIDTLKL